MVELVSLSTLGILFLILLGSPIALILTNKLPNSYQRGSFLVATALLTGFSIVAISAAWSFGLIGVRWFGFCVVSIFISSLILTLLPKFRPSLKRRNLIWDRFDLGLLLLIPISAMVNRVHIDPVLGLGFRSGLGPDTTQNLMTFIGSRNHGDTWMSMRKNFLFEIGAQSLYDGLNNIYTVSSFQAQAVYDYLLYGTRWGLSVPASVTDSLLGTQNTILYPALISSIGLLALGIITYGFLSAILRNLPLALCVSLTLIASGTLIYQTYNGGLAQAWALPGIGALSILLLIAFVKGEIEDKNERKALIGLAGLSWISMAVPYFDAALVMGLLILLIGIVQWIISKFQIKRIISLFMLSGLLASIVVLPFSLVSAYTLPIRLRLASGTGINSPNWPLPSEIFGFGDVWVSQRSALALNIGIVASLLIFSYFVRGLVSRKQDQIAIGKIGIAIFVIMGISAIAASLSAAGNNYIYVKVGAYLAPIAITGLYLLLTGKSIFNTGGLFRSTGNSNLETVKKQNFLVKFPAVPVILTTIAMVSSQITVNGLIPQGVYFPKDFGKIRIDSEAQKLLSEYNYFLFYTPSSNVLGAFADVIWISKAPNDLNLQSRSEKEIRVLCFSFNKECTPPGERIYEPNLEKYGLLSYETSISIKEYMALSIRDRYSEAFKQLGQDPVVIPERYLGGNPLLKP